MRFRRTSDVPTAADSGGVGTVGLEDIDDPVLTSDADGGAVVLNASARDAFGTDDGGDPWGSWDVRPAGGGPALARDDLPLARVLRGERVRDLELEATAPDRGTRTYRVDGELLGGRDGRPARAVVVFREIAREAGGPRADEGLTASLPVAVGVLRSDDGVLLSVNPAWERLFGYTRAEAIGMRYADVTIATAGTRRRRLAEVAEALDRGEGWRGEVESVRKDGTTFLAATELSRCTGPARGETWLVVQTDISARHGGAAAREWDIARWRSAFDEAPVGMAIIGPDLRMTDVNRRMCTLTGYTSAELIGASLPTLLHPDDVAPDAELAARLRAGELDRYRARERLVDVHGDVVPVEIWMTIVRAPDGHTDHEIAVIAER